MENLGTKLAEVERDYAGGDDRPLTGYLAVTGGYTALVMLAAGLLRLRGKQLPERVAAGDVVLLALATHKLSRVLTKDAVTSPLRAPFTRYEEPAGAGEVSESVRTDNPVRHSVGELLNCPFCVSVWLATALTVGLVLAPRLTRLVCGGLAAVTGSDFLQFAYAAARRADQPDR
ncbi:hypothetical protein JOF53_001140 [Crossiella equi]|uniref:DUF1360 domain-containing protein n=1 Tax=Crossiella equi TaxID=130796 RepID=A0ABS5A6P7_9PSEU|nr:DUF1360 domain-containing protein [Crossiella equi]MBP2472268.1 hypothetical protein [Crossiella equi]